MKKITFIGTGYVGLVSGACISDFGHLVTCVDISSEKIDQLKNNIIPIYEPGLKELVQKNTKAGRLHFSTNIRKYIMDSEVIFIAVGTPQSEDGSVDLSAIESVAKVIGENLNGYKVICTKSTVPVGTGDLIKNIIQNQNINKITFDYVSNPEFLREGSAVKDFLWPDRVVIGSDNEDSYNIMKEVYDPLYINNKPIVKTSIVTAEMIKYASNAFLALKISYINELANLCEVLGANIHQVAKVMGQDGRISPKFLHPGPGYGGSCFPKDTEALVTLSKNQGLKIRTIEAAINANRFQKNRMVRKMMNLIGGDFNNKKIAVLGLAFKPNTDDVRESASIEMIDAINKNGGIVKAYDPIANNKMKHIFNNIEYYDSWQEACKGADGVVIMTEWNEFRAISLKILKSLLNKAVVLDTRNILNTKKLIANQFKFDNVGLGISNAD
ncbi:MAG: UDP-glucose dehydrogenase family protein [Candidatus Neomarinimicrobiota bacterium]